MAASVPVLRVLLREIKWPANQTDDAEAVIHIQVGGTNGICVTAPKVELNSRLHCGQSD